MSFLSLQISLQISLHAARELDEKIAYFVKY